MLTAGGTLMSKKKIVATIEARMTSSRLPGKVLKPLAGKPALERVIERLKKSRHIHQIVVATTVNDTDLPIVDLCRELGVSVFRGSENDVLSRVLDAAKSAEADLIVEITGDCPLIDPAIVDQCIELFQSGNFDYVSNVMERTFPAGLATQVFPYSVLADVSSKTTDIEDREHVSLYIYTHPETYRLNNLAAPAELKHPEIILTLDTPEDYTVLSTIYDNVYPKNPNFTTQDVLDYLKKNPDLAKLNERIKRTVIKKLHA